MNKFKEIFLHSRTKYIILMVIYIALNIYYIFAFGPNYLVTYCNSFFFTGFTFLCLGGLSIVANYGAFNGFSYIGYYLKSVVRKSDSKQKFDYHDYLEEKTITRKNNRYAFGPYFLISIISLIISLIFYNLI